jgi:two-component system, sensor histidine kinase LadS
LFIALLAYNLLLYLMLRDTERFYYLVYLVSAYLSITSLNGFGALLLYPNSTWFGNEGVPFFGGCTFALILQFTRLFLSTADHPWLDRMIKGTIGAALLLAASPFLLPVRLTYELNLVMVFGFPVIGLVAGAATWIMGKREARFYILGQAASWIGLLVFGLLVRGVLPYRNILFEAISLGISADALLLALALADRVGMLRAAKLAAEEAMRQELETRQEQLEELVSQRTTELEIARKHAELLATTDVLTGVYNRRGVLACAERDLQIALRAEHPLSIATFDLDRFKRVNDTYGHAEGDRVLRDVAQVVLRTIRASDLMGRVGGEEFLVVMPDTALEDAAVAAERIRVALAANVFVGSPPVRITASFGIASLSDRCRTLDVLQSLADQALYCAKHNGRNRVELHGAGFTYLEA